MKSIRYGFIVLILFVLTFIYGCQDQSAPKDECEGRYKSAVNYVREKYYPYVKVGGMIKELQELIVNDAESLSNRYIELSSCYTKYIVYSRSGDDGASIFLARRKWVDEFGKFSGYLSALAGHLSEKGFKDSEKLDVEYMFFVEYLTDIVE